MVKICPKCGKNSFEESSFCEFCGTKLIKQSQGTQKSQFIQAQPIVQNSTVKRQKTNKKIFAIIILIILITAIFSVAILFLFSEEKDNFMGSWYVTYEYPSNRDNIWTFEEGGVLKMYSGREIRNSNDEQVITFLEDYETNTITVISIMEDYFEPTTVMIGTWKLENEMLCISANYNEICLNYLFSENNNKLTISGDGVSMQLTKTSKPNIDAEPNYGSIEIESLMWDHFEIMGSCNTSSLEYSPQEGDIITECIGDITIIFKETDTVIFDAYFP